MAGRRIGAARRRIRILAAGVSAAALPGIVAAQGPGPGSDAYSQQILNFARAVDSALHGSAGTGNTAYSHESTPRSLDETPMVTLSAGGTSAYTDCSGWVNFTLNNVAPIHHALVNDSRKQAPFAALGEGSKPWARAMVLQHYFNRMPVVGSADTSAGFQQVTNFGAADGTGNSLQAGDIVAYCEGAWCTPERSSGDTGHTFVVTGAPVAIPDEASYVATLGLSGNSGIKGLHGDEGGQPTLQAGLTVYAVPVIDSTSVAHYADDRDYGTIPAGAPHGAQSGGIGAGYLLLAVDGNGVVRQTRFNDGAGWKPYASGDPQKVFGAVRLTDSIALTEVLTVTKWQNSSTSYGGIDDLGQLPVNISGAAGGIALNGGGTLYLTGSNSYGGGTSVSQGSRLVVNADGNLGATGSGLTLADGALQVADGFASAAGRRLTLGNGGGSLNTTTTGGSATWAGPIAGSGALNIGRGHWALTGNGAGYSGAATIAGGASLQVAAGASLGGTIAVASGGTLSGAGTVGGIVNNGTVAPGAQAALTSTGSYVQGNGGTLSIAIASASAHDSVAAAGPATLGGTLSATALGGYVPPVGTSFTVLRAASVSGTFAAVSTQFSQTLLGRASYGPDRVTLTVERDYANAGLHGQLGDTDLFSVGTALNQRAGARSGALHDALGAIDRLTQASHAGAALHQLKPHNPSAHAATAIATARGHSNRVSGRLAALRDTPAPAASAGTDGSSGLSAGDAVLGGTVMQLIAAPDTVDPGRVPPVGVMDAGPTGPDPDRPFGVFAYGAGSMGYQDSSADREGYRFDGGGLTAGMDYRLRDGLVVGFAGSYSQIRTKYQGGADTTDAETWSLGPYAMYAQGPFYLEGSASYAWTSYDNSRTVTLPGWTATSSSSPDGRQYSLYAGGGYDFPIAPGTTLGPTGSLQYTRAEIDGYTETGSNPFNLTVGAQDLSSLQGSLGARLRGSFAGDWGRLLPELRLAWVHEFDNDPTTVTSQLSGGTIPFVTTSDDPIRDWVAVGGEVALRLSGSTSLFAAYDAQVSFNRENLAQTLNAGVRVAF